jgi:hypothetical protein
MTVFGGGDTRTTATRLITGLHRLPVHTDKVYEAKHTSDTSGIYQLYQWSSLSRASYGTTHVCYNTYRKFTQQMLPGCWEE